MEASPPSDRPEWQQALRDRCHHPSGTFVAFTSEDVEQSIPDRFEHIVRMWPDRLAIKTRRQSLTYVELNDAADRVARAIGDRRGREPEPVAVLAEPDVPGIVALLGVLKSGKFYVPVDPTFPTARIAHMLDDCQATLIMTTEDHAASAAPLAGARREILTIEALGSDPAAALPYPGISPDALACLLYTSGSSGQPKGVMENHRNLLHEIMRLTTEFHVCREDRITLLTSLSFSGSGRSIYGSLLNGAGLFPYDMRTRGPAGLARLLMDEGVTIYRSGPTAFRQFVETLTGREEFPRLRLITTAGEPVLKTDVELYRRHFDRDCLFVNGLRSTEAGSIRHYFMDKDTETPEAAIPVGFPVPDTHIVLIDDDGHEVRWGEVGEITVRSRYLSPGYWQRTELTKAKFLAAPRDGGARTFLTGDLGLMRPDGCLVHLGRKDAQVKVRGQRVEPAEIEEALLALPSVKEAVVVSGSARPGEVRLVAYVVPETDATPTTSALRRALAERLPDYMVPSRYVVLNALPVTPTGKLDRRALPSPGHLRPALDSAFLSPRSSSEKALVEIWADVLDLDEVGIHDDFFDLGGDSLRAAELLAEVETRFGRRLPDTVLLQAPTVEQLARIVSQDDGVAPHRALVAIRDTGHRPPLFCVPGHLGTVLCFRELARHVGADHPVYGLEARGLNGVEPPHATIEAMAAAYLTEILAREPTGPYFLLGYCFGGRVAFEMARQLVAGGRTVGLLGLLDSYGPGGRPGARSSLGRRTLRRAVQRLSEEAERLALLGRREKLAYPARLMGRVQARVGKRFERALGRTPASDAASRVADAHLQAARNHRPEIYPGPAILFRTGRAPTHRFIDPGFGWGHWVAGGLTVRFIPGRPGGAIKDDRARVLAAELRPWLGVGPA
jgi:amino acid adenylation domain-containing protein